MNYNNLAECPQFTVVNEYLPGAPRCSVFAHDFR